MTEPNPPHPPPSPDPGAPPWPTPPPPQPASKKPLPNVSDEQVAEYQQEQGHRPVKDKE